MTEDTQAMTIRLPAELHERLRRAAFETRVPMSQIVITAIKKELGNEDR
jgi:predicted transcriptional regulator